MQSLLVACEVLVITNTLSDARKQRGLSQASLASEVGISRQALGAIETGRSVPSTAVALRLAAALGTSVEALFALAGPVELEVARVPGERQAGGRAIVARVGQRWVAHRLPVDALATPADAELVAPRRVRLMRPRAELTARLLVAGCDPALGLLARAATREGVELAWLPMSSGAALGLLARGLVHVAGCHLGEGGASQNVPHVRRALPDTPFRLFTLAEVEAGLLARSGRGGVRGVPDLARRGVRLVNRAAGAGARALLDAELSRHGLRPDHVQGYATTVGGHRAVARAVSEGLADVGVATRALALAHGLRFVPLRAERFDLAAPESVFGLEAAGRLFSLLAEPAFKRQLAAIGGYSVAETGREVACA